MESILDYEQDFVKKGGISKFGGSDYGVNKGPRDFKGYQLEKLVSELQKYDISESRRYALSKEMYNLNSVEYMNMKYLASVLVFLDIIGNLTYEYEEEFQEIITDYFNDKNFMNPFILRIINLDKEKETSYIKKVKIIFYTYLYKIWINRSRKYDLNA
jgi:hypothetical protein